MSSYASICILAYQRLDFLKRTLQSLLNTPAGYPYELIIHDDGSDQEVKEYLYELQRRGELSWLVINNDKNMGIGRSVQNCFRISSGEYLFKVDADLEFESNWLAEAIKILGKPGIGCVSLFNYRTYAPNDNRFNVLQDKGDHLIVDDLVSSIYGVNRYMWEQYGAQLGTDGWHQHIKSQGYDLAITKQDMVRNFGFGADKSIYVVEKDGKYQARELSETPRLLGE